jgi:uncharacterized protein DUF6263
MFQFRHIALAVLASLSLIGGEAVAQDTAAPVEAKKPEVVKLTPTVKKGQVFHFLKGMSSETDFMGQGISNVTKFELTMTVKEVDEKGAFKTEVKIGRAYGSMNLPGMEAEFDTDKKPSEDAEEEPAMPGMPTPGMIQEQFQPLAGKVFKMHFDAQGKVIAVADVPDLLSGAGAGAMMGGGAAPSQDQLIAQLGAPFLALPAAGVAVGSHFEEKAKANAAGMQVNLKHTLQSADEKSFTLKSKGDVKMGDGGGMLEQMGAEVEEARASGKASYSRVDGLPLSFERKMEVAMILENEMMGGEIEIETVTKETFERVKGFAKKPAKKAEAKPAEGAGEGDSKGKEEKKG